ncbi:MAG: VOC family protein [Christensenella sp.]|uniref:VOC family protein n=1 Tax=Christensenella sp. TaxID=1935934 RepID=UPI002B1F5605|nr:VOC family protein [Christensenella sp.]MEA5003273.1 VOC family protein [Christensenella sp.]
MAVIKKVDHIVITTAHMKECLAFYEKLGFSVRDAGGRYELFAGDFKINVHAAGAELSPHAAQVTPGSADLCFEVDGDIGGWKQTLEACGIAIELGIVRRHGVSGKMDSIYLRDPDGNLIELCSYI